MLQANNSKNTSKEVIEDMAEENNINTLSLTRVFPRVDKVCDAKFFDKCLKMTKTAAAHMILTNEDCRHFFQRQEAELSGINDKIRSQIALYLTTIPQIVRAAQAGLKQAKQQSRLDKEKAVEARIRTRLLQEMAEEKSAAETRMALNLPVAPVQLDPIDPHPLNPLTFTPPIERLQLNRVDISATAPITFPQTTQTPQTPQTPHTTAIIHNQKTPVYPPHMPTPISTPTTIPAAQTINPVTTPPTSIAPTTPTAMTPTTTPAEMGLDDFFQFLKAVLEQGLLRVVDLNGQIVSVADVKYVNDVVEIALNLPALPPVSATPTTPTRPTVRLIPRQ